MKVKELDRTVNVAWSPAAQHPIMLAAGTAAQQLDASFSTNAALEIYSLNLSEPGLDMELRSVTPSDHRFHKLAWGSYGQGGEHGSGIIVGGCDAGRIQMYSAGKLLAGEDGVIARQDKHTGPVRALDFNPFQSNLLATGASDSEIYIWDLNNTAAPMTPGAKSQPGEDVLWISWNQQVQHILASTFQQRCVVWDLRKNEPIIKLSDSNSRIRWKVVAWHPEVATQLCLASEEDQTPVIQLWDLRFATSPLKVLENHQRGILSIAWCARDPDLLLSCGKDDRILCWNPNSDIPGGEVVCDVATSNQWNFDVSWCPRNPAIIASSSFDGHVSIYSLMGGQSQVQTSNKIADSFPGMDPFARAPVSQQQQVHVDLRRPPKWLRRPVGASFGFGGKLVTFDNDGGRFARVSQVVTESELVARSQLLEATLGRGDFADFCSGKLATVSGEHERTVWACLRANFLADPRSELLAIMGYREEDLNDKLVRLISKPANARPEVDSLTDGMANLHRDPESEDELELGTESGYVDSNGDASAAFDTIAATTKATPEKKPFRIKTGDDIDGMICQSLLLGNTEAAVELCLQDGRMADAIILAMTGGSDLLARTQYRYFQQTQGYLSSLISAVVTEDWSQVVRSCEVSSWKEALAAALSHTSADELAQLCNQLGERLEVEGGGGALSLNAQLCFICAGNLDRLVDSWTRAVKPSTPQQMQELVELVMVLRQAASLQGRSVEVSGKLAALLSHYAALLASQGSLDAALAYLGDSTEESIVLLRDRLSRSLGHLPAYQQQQQQPSKQQQPRQKNFHPEQPASQSYPNQAYPGYPSSYPGQGQPAASSYAPSTQQRPYQSNSPALPGASSRGKYKLDPTVQKATNTIAPFSPSVLQPQLGAYGSSPQPGPYALGPQPGSFAPGPQPSTFAPGPQPSTFAPGPQPGSFAPNPQTSYLTPTPQQTPSQGYNSAQQSGAYGGAYNPQDQFNTADPNQAMLQPSNAPPGWNDPPMVKNAARNQNIGGGNEPVEMSARHAGTRKWQTMIAHSHDQPKTDYVPQNPITHPLYAGASSEQQQMPQMGGPPPLSAYNGQTYEHQPMAPQQPFVPQHQFNNSNISQSSEYSPAHHQAPPVAKVAEPPKPKGPIPEEHMYLQIVFDELQTRCTCAANNPQSRRKLEDVSRKLATLYDCLRESKLSGNTLQGLHQMVQLVQIGDYTRGLELHTQLVSGPDFAQIASFMPGLKVLLQSALQLNVYLQ